jgi:hypothetical protein
MAMKKFFFGLGSFSIKDGSKIRFWEDKWLGNASLVNTIRPYIALCVIRQTIAKVMETSPPAATFRRDLSGQRLVAWNALLQRLANIQLQNGHDEFRWNLNENGNFLVASMYNALLPDVLIDKICNNKLWKLKIPLWIKIFRWYLRKGVILIKDNLAKRN